MAKLENLRRRCEVIFGCEPAPSSAVTTLESRLGVQLPDDFKTIATFYSGGYLGGKSLYTTACDGKATSIGDETERLRDGIGLPTNFVVLAEPSSSLIVMDCTGRVGSVLWIDATDAPNLKDLARLRSPEVWESYSAFFQELLDEEEKEQFDGTA